MTSPFGVCESSTPPRYVIDPAANATDDVVARATLSPDRPAFARKVDGEWRTVTWAEFAGQVTALAGGLIAAGVEPGDRVAVMSGTRYEWVLCDLAIWTAGTVSVPVYETSSAAQVSWILSDSEAVAAIVENERCRALVEQAAPEPLRQVWQIEGGDLNTLAHNGERVSTDAIERRRRGVTAESPATIVYTSGTTGRPKGCLLRHSSLLGEVRNLALADGIREHVLGEHTSLLLFLPLAHIFARMVQLIAIHNGAMTAHTSDVKTVAAELESFRPTLVLAVPRVFEKFTNAARRTAAASGRARLFRAAENTAVEYSRALDHGRPSRWLRARRRLWDRLVYRRLRAAFGGRLACAVCGGAPLSARLGHFLRGIGVPVLEGYGLTEATAGVTLNLPAAQRIGSVGRPVPGCTVRISTDGEVLVSGSSVFGGYWHNVQETRVALDDGWLRTGDLGELDIDGFLTITGRKKDVIVTASGKNVAPAVLEDTVRQHWLVDQCVVVGDRRPYIGALVTLDRDALAEWKREHHIDPDATIAELRGHPELLAAIQAAVDDANRAVSHAEAIKRFRIVPVDFLVGAELTPTEKVRRDYVVTTFAHEIDALYTDPA